MKELIKFARLHNVIRNVYLDVKTSNVSSSDLYEKIGFEKDGVHKNYFKVNGIFDYGLLMDLYL